jgi:hypothetical protein
MANSNFSTEYFECTDHLDIGIDVQKECQTLEKTSEAPLDARE